jgi:hypothetical protein
MKIDPELLRQLDDGGSGEPVQAIVRLRVPDPAKTVAAPEETEATAQELVDRVQKLVGEQEAALNIFRNLGTFMICAQPRFLRALMQQPEVASVTANQQPGSAKIDPVHKRPATLEEVGRERAAVKRPVRSQSETVRTKRRRATKR